MLQEKTERPEGDAGVIDAVGASSRGGGGVARRWRPVRGGVAVRVAARLPTGLRLQARLGQPEQQAALDDRHDVSVDGLLSHCRLDSSTRSERQKNR